MTWLQREVRLAARPRGFHLVTREVEEAVPEDADHWTHTLEGPDDMPAHIKSSLTGSSLSLPISDGRLALGTWQGIYLCEHRDSAGPRTLLVTAWGEER